MFSSTSIPSLIEFFNLFQHLIAIGKMIKMPLPFNKVQADVFGGMG